MPSYLDYELANLRDQMEAVLAGPWELDLDPLSRVGAIQGQLDRAQRESHPPNVAGNAISEAMSDAWQAALACAIEIRHGTGLVGSLGVPPVL